MPQAKIPGLRHPRGDPYSSIQGLNINAPSHLLSSSLSSTSRNLTSSTFYYCTFPPTPTAANATTVWTTTYETVLLTACPTTCFLTTYTITETCTGNSATFMPPTVPAGFVTETVTCPVCPTPTMVITCPGPEMTAATVTGTANNNAANTRIAAGASAGAGAGGSVGADTVAPASMTPGGSINTAAPPRVTAGAPGKAGGAGARKALLAAASCALLFAVQVLA